MTLIQCIRTTAHTVVQQKAVKQCISANVYQRAHLLTNVSTLLIKPTEAEAADRRLAETRDVISQEMDRRMQDVLHGYVEASRCVR